MIKATLCVPSPTIERLGAEWRQQVSGGDGSRSGKLFGSWQREREHDGRGIGRGLWFAV